MAEQSTEMQGIVPISEHYTAERYRNQYGASTRVCFRVTPDAKFPSVRIEISSMTEWGFERSVSTGEWTKATINWFAIGSVSSAEAAEFAVALNWAIEEAARMDEFNAAS